MINLLKQEVIKQGDKASILAVNRLKDLKQDIDRFKKQNKLNKFHKYIVNNIYNFSLPTVDFDVQSIIIIAVPRPMYANVEFIYQGKSYKLKSLVISNMNNENAFIETEKYLTNLLSPQGYHIKLAPNLPYKRVAARSGLATYGRNNICYVAGMGSSLTLVAYYSDVPCLKDDWTIVKKSPSCTNCKACINSCPTNAIKEHKFLIDNDKCLSYFNESPREFPEWIPLSAHHCIYDCLKCQIICPMNKNYINNIIGPIKFTEQETEIILSQVNYQEFDSQLQRKVDILGMKDWLKAIPRNLLVLFKAYDRYANE